MDKQYLIDSLSAAVKDPRDPSVEKFVNSIKENKDSENPQVRAVYVNKVLASQH